MTAIRSFTKYENEALARFRPMIAGAESTEDVKKFFAQVTRDMLTDIFGGHVDIRLEDVALNPVEPPHFLISSRLMGEAGFSEAWEGSDLRNILARMAETARNRHTHLEKNPDRTEKKIYHKF